eukprot:7841241-Pyramimonas_sp.AAC.1
MDVVWGVGECTKSEPVSGSLRPWTHQLDFATGSEKVPSTGFHLRAILLAMILSGHERLTAEASRGAMTSTAPEPSILFHSESSEISNFCRSAGDSFPRVTSPPLLAANTSTSSSGPGTS